MCQVVKWSTVPGTKLRYKSWCFQSGVYSGELCETSDQATVYKSVLNDFNNA